MSSLVEISTIAHRDLAQVDGLSPLGLVVQGLRINCLPPMEVFSTMGLHLTYMEDWSQRLCLSPRHKASLLTRFPSASVLEPLWDIQRWRAFGDGQMAWRPVLTACPECLKSGYHSMLFQMPWVNYCPWHRVPLTERCASCSKPLWQSISRDAPPLLCECGHDPVRNEELIHEPGHVIERRRAYLKRYLVWAQASRTRRDVFGIEDIPGGWDDLGSRLFRPGLPWRAPEVRDKDRDVMARTSIVHHPTRLSHEGREQLTRIALDTSMTKEFFLELPASVERSMKRVSASIASKFPPKAFSERERACLGLPSMADPAHPPPRPSVILLTAYRVNERVFFDGRILAKPVQAMLQDICLAVAKGSDDDRRIDSFLRAYERVLARGYAAAAFHALSTLVTPTSHAMTASLRKPIVFIQRRKTASRVTVLWLRDPMPKA